VSECLSTIQIDDAFGAVTFYVAVCTLQQIAFKNLVERNRRTEHDSGTPDPGSIIRLPFIVVNTSKSTVIDCSISDDKYVHVYCTINTVLHFIRAYSLKN